MKNKILRRTFIGIAAGLLLCAILLCGCSDVATSVIPFQSRAVALLPPAETMDKLEIQKKPQAYTRKNLFDLIGGEAEFFFSYGYRASAAAEYVPVGPPREIIHAHVYDMGRHLNAFGIYSNYSNPDGEFFNLGADASFYKNTLVFYKGNFFVRVFSHSHSKKLQNIVKGLAAEIEKNIHGKTTPPKTLKLLPADGLVAHSKRYITGGVLGYAPLRKGVTADYIVKGQKVTAFICSYWEPFSALDALSKMQKLNQSSPFVSPKIKGTICHKDLGAPGVFIFCAKGSRLIGIKGLEKKEDGVELLRKIIDNL